MEERAKPSLLRDTMEEHAGADSHIGHTSCAGSAMAEGRTCALPGCSKRPYPSLDQSKPHLACGNLHHLLLMAARFHPAPPDPAYHQMFARNAAGRCALVSCSEPPFPGHSWCSRRHYLDWLSDFTSGLEPDQFCKLPGCVRHVFVDGDGSRLQFCGWEHLEKSVVRSALKGKCQENAQQEGENLPRSLSAESKCGHVPSLESLFHAFSEFAVHGNPPDSIEIDENFFNKHPWDICNDTYWLIVLLKDMSKIRGIRLTKDGYRWKQQGPASRKRNGFIQKYFSYQALKGRQIDTGCIYHLKEYTIDSNNRFALINVRKGAAGRKLCKGEGVLFNSDVSSKNTSPIDGEEMAEEILAQIDFSPVLASATTSGSV